MAEASATYFTSLISDEDQEGGYEKVDPEASGLSDRADRACENPCLMRSYAERS
jgi:hypothetical protein